LLYLIFVVKPNGAKRWEQEVIIVIIVWRVHWKLYEHNVHTRSQVSHSHSCVSVEKAAHIIERSQHLVQ
jgi:hypothetical protein